MAEISLDGKVVIVTGAARGMGRVMARSLAQSGARVAAIDSDKDGLTSLAAEVAASVGDFLPIEADLAKVEACATSVARVVKSFGTVDGLVNNAGVGMQVVKPNYSLEPARFWEAPPDRWQLLMDINLRAPFLMARAAVPHMLDNGWGRIVNVTTSLDTMLFVGMAPYGQSKAGLESGSAIWAKDLAGTGITVNVLVPGGPVNSAFLPENTRFPRDQLIQPEVMAEPIAWLCSTATDGVTGRRFIACDWDPGCSLDDPAALASAPAGWGDSGTSAVRPNRT